MSAGKVQKELTAGEHTIRGNEKGGVVVCYAISTTSTTPLVIFERCSNNIKYGKNE
jgi:hypothetical protein